MSNQSLEKPQVEDFTPQKAVRKPKAAKKPYKKTDLTNLINLLNENQYSVINEGDMGEQTYKQQYEALKQKVLEDFFTDSLPEKLKGVIITPKEFQKMMDKMWDLKSDLNIKTNQAEYRLRVCWNWKQILGSKNPLALINCPELPEAFHQAKANAVKALEKYEQSKNEKDYETLRIALRQLRYTLNKESGELTGNMAAF